MLRRWQIPSQFARTEQARDEGARAAKEYWDIRPAKRSNILAMVALRHSGHKAKAELERARENECSLDARPDSANLEAIALDPPTFAGLS